MDKKRKYKITTLQSINRALDVAGIHTVKAVKGSFKFAAMSLLYDDELASLEDVEKAKRIVEGLMGDMWWGDPG